MNLRHIVKPLELIEKRCVTAALGWLELGNPAEANEELENFAVLLGQWQAADQ